MIAFSIVAVCEVRLVAMPGGASDLVRIMPADEDPVSDVRGNNARSTKD